MRTRQKNLEGEKIKKKKIDDETKINKETKSKRKSRKSRKRGKSRESRKSKKGRKSMVQIDGSKKGPTWSRIIPN